MPLTPQYTWEETEATVSVTITAPGLTKAKSDLLISDTYVGVSCPPYLLQLDLAHAIDETDGRALFGTASLVLRLNKVGLQKIGAEVRAGFVGTTTTTTFPCGRSQQDYGVSLQLKAQNWSCSSGVSSHSSVCSTDLRAGNKHN